MKIEMQRLSSYLEGLPLEAKTQYLEKIAVIGGVDPFNGGLRELIDDVPPIDTCDLVGCLPCVTN